MMVKTKGTRRIVDCRRIAARHYEWLLTCGHVVTVIQQPRTGQSSAVCETCRGGPANKRRSKGDWKTAGEAPGPAERAPK